MASSFFGLCRLSISKLNRVDGTSDRGNRMIYGTDDGVYFSNHRDERLRHPTKVISMPDVTQVDVLEEFQLLVVLSGARCSRDYFVE